MRLPDRQFLFRVPGSKTMFDFDKLPGMNLPGSSNLEVVEQHRNQRTVEKMSVATVLAKFG